MLYESARLGVEYLLLPRMMSDLQEVTFLQELLPSTGKVAVDYSFLINRHKNHKSDALRLGMFLLVCPATAHLHHIDFYYLWMRLSGQNKMVGIKLMCGEKREGRERDKGGKNGGHEGQELEKKRRYRGMVRRKEERDEGMKKAQASGMLMENGKKNQRFQSFIKNFAHNHGKLK